MGLIRQLPPSLSHSHSQGQRAVFPPFPRTLGVFVASFLSESQARLLVVWENAGTKVSAVLRLTLRLADVSYECVGDATSNQSYQG